MVFVGGPRQVGKTTLAFHLLKNGNERHPDYFNWDFREDRLRIRNGELPFGDPLLILDEVHKFKDWRNLIKGFYDKFKSKSAFLVTGSARLDYYKRGGDSLAGRYHYYRLHPFSLKEMAALGKPADTDSLLKFGGFPEPLHKGSERFWRRWQKERLDHVIKEDLRDLENVKDVDLVTLLADTLPLRVGAPLSIKSLREDLEVAHQTVDRWVRILEHLYFCFRIPPFLGPKIRAVKKEKKLYLWDWSLCADAGCRFENLVACQLLKYCHFLEDTQGYRMELRFLRDIDKREIDFVVLRDRRPQFAVECKTGDSQLSPAIRYYAERTAIPKFYQVHLGKRHFQKTDQRALVIPFPLFCQELSLP
ncbi:MAG: ATP-binding protein [Deltaproteobacteria bacterium]|nr:ATP-binding protein [Deltaproteobacteria bacterium]MBI4223489.1 ATP-binding protein [Deltaproteobacteria bacterium]